MKEKEKEEVIIEEITTDIRKLILFNSNHLWEDVINQLQKATGYDIIHCEQIATIAHIKGNATVKTGKFEELIGINRVLKEIHLITEIK
jgi:hypothetical protein